MRYFKNKIYLNSIDFLLKIIRLILNNGNADLLSVQFSVQNEIKIFYLKEHLN